MECLQVVLEDEGMQTYLQENEAVILEATEEFHQFPQTVKDYVTENLEEFIGTDVNETFANIVEFTKNAGYQHLCEVVSAIEV